MSEEITQELIEAAAIQASNEMGYTPPEERIAMSKASDAVLEAEYTKEPDPLDTPEVAEAAKQYAAMVKEIRARSKNMTAGGLARVLISAAEFPFSENYPKLRVKTEQELLMLVLTNDRAKGVITNALRSQEAVLKQTAADNVSDQILSKGDL